MKTASKIVTLDLGVDVSAADELDLITLAEATELLKGRKGRIALQTLQRFANPRRGRIFGDVRVVLPTVYRAGARWTTREAVEAWQRKCDQLGQDRPSPAVRSMNRATAAEHRRSTKRLRGAKFAV